MHDVSFTISITGWTSTVNGHSLPICEISSPVKIDNAVMHADVYPTERLNVHLKNGQHVSSFIFWNGTRIHASTANIDVIMVNLEDKVGIVLYSKTVDFAVLIMRDDKAIAGFTSGDQKGVYHGFAVLQNNEKIHVKVGDEDRGGATEPL